LEESQFLAWKHDAESALARRYAIGLNDAGVSDQELANHFRDGSGADEFVEWFGRKYDLIERPEFLVWSR